MKRIWLKDYPWSQIEKLNEALCSQKNALHKATSDGYLPAKSLWESRFDQELSLEEVIQLCRKCHQLAPFCFYNGNTFVAVAKAAMQILELSEESSFILRSLAGHLVAGTEEGDESEQFAAKCRQWGL